MHAFYYAMPTLAVTVIAAYIFTSVKLHKFIWVSPVVYLALLEALAYGLILVRISFQLQNKAYLDC